MMVTVVAFQAMGVSTALPAAARELDGLGAYGWAFSAFLLASVLGMVGAGQASDSRGPVRPFLAGVLVFAGGSVLAALSGSWAVLIAGRALQGLANGAIISLVYVAVARAYPPALYGRVLALVAGAWMLPSLIGPGVGGIVAEQLGWRWVFLMLLPLLPVAAFLPLAGLRTLEHEQHRTVDSRLPAALALTAGLGALLGALQVRSPVAGLALALGGVALGGPAFRRLLPAGTLRFRRGLPAGVAVRGLVAVGYVGADAFMPLALTRVHGLSLVQAGLVITAGSTTWNLAGVAQGRLDRRDGGAGRARRVLVGATILAAGAAITTAGFVFPELTVAVPIAGWMVSGLGVGIAYSSVAALALSQSPAGDEGSVSAALQLIEAIGVAVFAGLGGALLAAGLEHGWPTTTAMGLVFACAAACAVAALPAGRRLTAPSSR
jgi:MFS family permease